MIQIELDRFEERSKCTGCGACTSVCPQHCIAMQEDSEGFLYPLVDMESCIECGLCERSCPVIKKASVSKEGKSEELKLGKPSAYAVINKNDKIRLESSSGGIFTLLAEQVILEGGYVYGAVMSEDCTEVYHIGTNKIEELDKFRGSKYLQSTIADVYRKIRVLLEEGKAVLFSGTPCQIEGLKSYLAKEYESLFCMDFICHGCPSPKVWRKYIDFRLRQEGETSVRQTLFRHKIYGWKAYALLFEYSNNKAYVGKNSEDLYMRAFLNDAVLRPSCHACWFKQLQRKSDITLADFWGVHNIVPEMDDDKGTSLVILHSKKGKELFEKLASKMLCKEVDVVEAVKYNSAMICSAKANKNRADFFENLDVMEFDELVEKFAKPRFCWKQKMKNFLNKLGVYNNVKKFYIRCVRL